MGGQDFTHLNDKGEARMVDVGSKEPTSRKAIARAQVNMSQETLDSLTQGTITKGDVFAIARVAGIQAAKKTSELIPLCHPRLCSTQSKLILAIMKVVSLLRRRSLPSVKQV